MFADGAVAVTTADQRTFLLSADPEPVSTVAAEVWEDNEPHEKDWLFAEGERVGLGEPMTISIPAR